MMNIEGWDRIETPLGEVFIRGSEIHLNPDVQCMVSRRHFQDVFGPIIEEYGFVTTRVPHGMSDEFTRRIGFEVTWADDHFTYYIMEHVPFSRKDKTCQQQP